mgnify:CR=1 FL=1
MRHRISGRKLNRKTSHRMALLKNLAKSLITNEQIETTLPKAKDLRPFVEKIVQSGKNNSLHSRRKVFSFLRDNILVNKVFDVLAKRYANRNGGYTRVLRSGFRYGDAAPKAIIELVDRDISAKGYADKKRIEELKKQGEQKTPQDKVINDEAQIKSNEQKQNKIADKAEKTKQSPTSKKEEKDSKG